MNITVVIGLRATECKSTKTLLDGPRLCQAFQAALFFMAGYFCIHTGKVFKTVSPDLSRLPGKRDTVTGSRRGQQRAYYWWQKITERDIKNTLEDIEIVERSLPND